MSETQERTAGEKWVPSAALLQAAHDEEVGNIYRILGARDGYIGALIKVRQQIGRLANYNHIDPRHVRKLAERERILAPLRALERMFEEAHKSCGASFAEKNAARKARSVLSDLGEDENAAK